MDKTFKELDQRLRKTCGRCCVEPDGQDGVSCLLLAVMDQLQDLNLDASGCDHRWLRANTSTWMIENRSLLVSDEWKQTYSSVAELSMLCEFGPDYCQLTGRRLCMQVGRER